MEIKVLRVFLAVVEHRGISAAAESLGVTQSTVSRQLQSLEDELGVTLFVRGNRGRQLSLTPDGRVLLRRAQEIVSLSDRAMRELTSSDGDISGDVTIGAAEADVMRYVARIAVNVRERNPHIHFHIDSGIGPRIIERLDDGLVDFVVVLEPVDLGQYNYMHLPVMDSWAVVMRKDHPLAAKEAVSADDLRGVPLIIPSNSERRNDLSGWLGGNIMQLNVVGTMNLLHNGALMVEEGYGCAVAVRDSLLDTSGSLCMRPLTPQVDARLSIAWKQNVPMSAACRVFLEALRDELADEQ